MDFEGVTVSLYTIARTLREGMGEKGSIARYGGDQFLILMPDTDARTAQETGDRLRGEACETKIYRADRRPLPPVTLSGGLASDE